ncbi:MAG: N-acetyltransferase [Methylobacterium sp.]|uniref:GNAT family N-acetyltransferase n=1 Tax=Methylobacterium sp. TaxID=409 RepID=UPI0025E6C5D7|nr:N-acetyltransferase [Methylobacterium sp.]MBX9931275.1 N-acetyltransferase [Methylobacterium sp.]
MTTLPLLIRPELPDDAQAVERLHARAFGPGRYARTPYRLREGVPHRPDLSFTALVGTFLVGSVRMGPILIGGRAALMLGPLAVDPSFENRGIGSGLMNRSLDAARAGGEALVLLVGDAPFYARFGFERVPAGTLMLPGPVDPGRVLWLALQDGAKAMRGMVTGG